MTSDRGGNRLRAGQVLAGILDNHPGSPSFANGDNGARPRATPVVYKRRASLWQRLLLALGDEFPRYEMTRPVGGESGRLAGTIEQGRHAR